MQTEVTEMGFNSSLVRLGVMDTFAVGHGILVSIPAWCDWEKKIFRLLTLYGKSFNSSLVRLGDSNNIIFGTRASKFQFQLGAIGRIHCSNVSESPHEFQFQLGAIGSIGNFRVEAY